MHRMAVVGPGGFGAQHVRALDALADQGVAALAAVVSRPGENEAEVARLRERGVPVHPSLGALLNEEGEAIEAVSLPTSIPSHAELTIQALEAGRHVYCEKPAAATIQEVGAMLSARDRSGRLCAVGFQDMPSPALQRAKEALCAGRIGRLRFLKAYALAPRGDAYYARNEWAGRLCAGGAWVLDGPANNASAHPLNILLYLAGPERFAPAVPARVTAELYRANPIESYDTCSLRVRTADDVEILFYVTHAGERTEPPRYEMTGDRGTLRRWGARADTELRPDGAPVETWSNGDLDLLVHSFRHFCGCLDGEEQLLSPVENARSHTVVINGAHEASAIPPIPAALCARGDSSAGPRTFVRGLDDTVVRAFEQSELLSESGVEWAVPGREVDVTGYSHFPRAAAG